MDFVKVAGNAFNHFFNLTCPACKSNILSYSDKLCPSCQSKLDYIHTPYCISCGGNNDTIFPLCSKCIHEEKHPWQKAVSALNMKGFSRDLIIKYKYYDNTALVRYFAKISAKIIINNDINPDIITYIPLHWTKYFKRSFNQSKLLANFISKRINIPAKRLLKRNKFTKSQTKLDSKQRRKNIVGAFSAANVHCIINKKILLIDDVYTTGTTLRTGTKELLTAGAKEVYIFTLARR